MNLDVIDLKAGALQKARALLREDVFLYVCWRLSSNNV